MMAADTTAHYRPGQRGQAATEFVVASVFILVPLFLIIPLLGKYIDIHHAAIQQARYEVWEYSVWFGPDESIMSGIEDHEDQYAGRKKYDDARKEGLSFFFSNPNGGSYGTAGSVYVANPLWFDHRGDSLFKTSNDPQPAAGNPVAEGPTPDGAGQVIDTILDLVSDVTKVIGGLLHLFHVDADFDAIYTDGYFTSTVDIPVRSLDAILPDNTPAGGSGTLDIQARASLLTNGWNAGSRDNATAESRGLVFTSLLSPLTDTLNTVINALNTVLGYIPLLDVKLPYMPAFGYVDDDLIPYEHIEGGKWKLKEEHGLYYYEEDKK